MDGDRRTHATIGSSISDDGYNGIISILLSKVYCTGFAGDLFRCDRVLIVPIVERVVFDQTSSTAKSEKNSSRNEHFRVDMR